MTKLPPRRELCQICGVRFNINRVRSHNEPRSAAYNGHPGSWVRARYCYDAPGAHNGHSDENSDDTDDDGSDTWGSPLGCSDETGCSMVFRAAELAAVGSRYGVIPGAGWSEENENNDDPKRDPDHVYESADEDEALEYDSDSDGSVDVDMDMDNPNDSVDDDEADEAQNQENIGHLNANADPARAPSPAWRFQVNPTPPTYDTEFLPLTAALTPLRATAPSHTQDYLERVSMEYHEHIAGPGCQNTEAYLPHAISAEEMRNCHTVQCLLRKPRGWQPAGDNIDFEKGSEYFLTGLADRMPTSLWDMEIEPARYGIGDGLRSQSAFYIEETQEDLDRIGLPFHPTCFELFIQASRKILGRVDIDALMQIRDRAALRLDNFPITHQDDVRDEQEQVWKHTAGREYLVANPVFVPELAPTLAASIVLDDTVFSIQRSPFASRADSNYYSSSGSANDPFLRLPPELIHIIVWELDSPDIAALRLSSRAFIYLPISLWHHLLMKEIPSLYEAWSSDPAPYYWSTLLATDIIKEKRAREKFLRDLEEPITNIRQDMPDIAEEWIRDASKWEWPADPDREEMLKLSPIRLPYERTNWYQLYRDIVVNNERSKGLKNRVRIWDAVLQIVDAIQELRGEESAL
ncbi:hypothetical protein BJX65DRAFT_302026 [Aspergillus insuetus]